MIRLCLSRPSCFARYTAFTITSFSIFSDSLMIEFSWGQCSALILCLHDGQLRKLKTILGVAHLFSTILIKHLRWNTCLQPIWTHGSAPKPEVQQIEQYVSSLVSGCNFDPAFFAHSSSKQGRQTFSF